MSYECSTRRWNLVIPVWGEHYVAIFTQLTLPFLLSPGNLPGLARPDLFTLRILTGSADVQALKDDPAIGRARERVRVEIVEMPATLPQRLRHLPFFSQIYAMEIEHARDREEDVLLWCADSPIADGGLRSLERRRGEGFRVIFVANYRAEWQSLSAVFAARRCVRTGGINFPARELVEVTLRARHEWTRRLEFGDGVVRGSPGVFWIGPDSNFLITSLMLHPIYLDTRVVPQGFAEVSVGSIDLDLPSWLMCSPEETYTLRDTDEFFAVEISQEIALPTRERIAGGNEEFLVAWTHSIADFARGYLAHRPGLSFHLALLGQVIYGHSRDDCKMDPWMAAAAQRLSDKVRERLATLPALASAPPRRDSNTRRIWTRLARCFRGS